MLAASAGAQTVADSPELYAGEKALYEAAKKEGMVVSFDTGPTWANWAADSRRSRSAIPDVEIIYNDLGSAATVVALDKATQPPAGRYRVLLRGLGDRRGQRRIWSRRSSPSTSTSCRRCSAIPTASGSPSTR